MIDSDLDSEIITKPLRVYFTAADDHYLVDALLAYRQDYQLRPSLEWSSDAWNHCVRILREKGSKASLRRGLTEEKLERHYQKHQRPR